MIEWYWLLVAFLAGPLLVAAFVAILVAAAEPDGEEFYRPQDPGEGGAA